MKWTIDWEHARVVLAMLATEIAGLAGLAGFGIFMGYAGLLTGGLYILLGGAICAACLYGTVIEAKRFVREKN